MSNPHEFLVGKDPIKTKRLCKKCGGEPDYWDSSKCGLCGFRGSNYKEDFPERLVATVDWEKIARALK